jgi:hypothetical protein
MIIIVNDPDLPFDRRSAERDTSKIPMPFDLLIHSEGEWNSIKTRWQILQNTGS